MSFVEDLAADRQMFLDGLERNKEDINLHIFEDFYPDKAHFIYELLQNAEDTGATEATFELTADAVAFEHSGHPFTEENVRRITGIGVSDKKNQEDKIGRFGIGFKAVFAYTDTPYVWSRTYSFKISDWVLPTAISAKPELGDTTRFELPFNNLKKPALAAYEEIKAKLEGLAETTLLFLSNLKSITWRIGSESSGGILRMQHSEHHVEVLKEEGPKMTSSSHFLRFSAPVNELPGKTVSVAFPLGFLPNAQQFDPAKPISQQLKTVPTTGCVAVYFPAEKETSGLRFHLHAPFVPELSRASIKETSANTPLFKQLAALSAASLHTIRELKLLTGEFLGVLPNPQDDIPLRYQPIRDAITKEMKDEPLTPTHSKSHAPAKCLLQAKASLKDFLTEEDLCFLVDRKEESPRWAISATQRNGNQDRFLEGLEITIWDLAEFSDLLKKRSSEHPRYLSSAPWVVYEPDATFIEWLAAKSVEWHQRLYSLLYEHYKGLAYDFQRDEFKKLPIVRLSDGSYNVGNRCYFPSDGVVHDPLLPRVDAGLYASGKNKSQQESARKLLEELGVRVVGEAEQIESILKQRYKGDALEPDVKDVERFIALVENEPTKAKLFADFYIFRITAGRWEKPSSVFLDSPYKKTGLSAYFDALGENETSKKWALSDSYRSCGIPKERISEFAKAVGAQTKLYIECRSTYWHRSRATLRADHNQYRVRLTDTAIDEDWAIPNLELLLPKRSEVLSRLVWQVLCESDEEVLKARFRPNQKYLTREQPSSLVLLLQETPWIPQNNGDFVRPPEASRTLLPKGFPFDEGYEWLKAVRFGQNERQQSEEHKKRQASAKELGFPDDDALAKGQWFAGLDPEEQQRVKDEVERKRQFVLPEHEPHNARRRDERVTQRAKDALERISELRRRSVSVGWEAVKQDAEPYLIEQYTNQYEEMFCQVCKAPLPFKLADGSYYFVMVEFLPELQNRHYQNYLALCPNHAAMYQYANGSRDLMEEMFMTMDGNKLEVILAQQNATIYFTGTHAADLRAVIAADQDTTTKAGDA